MTANWESNFKKIITGEKNYATTMVALSFLITRLKTQYKKNPNDMTLNQCIQETKKFFDKYAQITQSEIKKIESL